eukprot:764122-Hanusia_phi.AAC.4
MTGGPQPGAHRGRCAAHSGSAATAAPGFGPRGDKVPSSEPSDSRPGPGRVRHDSGAGRVTFLVSRCRLLTQSVRSDHAVG